MYNLSTLPKRTAPMTKPPCGQYSPVLACDRRLSRSLLDDEECLLRFAVEQGLGQGCVLEPLLFSILFVTVMKAAQTRLKAAQTRLKADNDIRGWGSRGGQPPESHP